MLIPPPKSHLQHYHGVFASNAPFRRQITAHANKLLEERVPVVAQEEKVTKRRSYSWAKLLARIYEVFPLICSCGQSMKIIAFITNPHTARQILAHLKFCTNSFDALPFQPQEPEYTICDIVPNTTDGFPDPYDAPCSQPIPNVIRWKDTSRLAIDEFANIDKPILEYETCDLIPGTPDGFPDPHVAEPVWLDLS